MPLDDSKNAHCKPLNYVEITDDLTGDYIGLFRIIPSKTRKLLTVNEVQYELEHVLAVLMNDVLFRYHQRTNHTTASNIEYILSQQTTENWRLGDCEITRYFHYKWENENGLLGALFSLTDPFDEPYEWTWDTTQYPWTLNLVKPDTEPTAKIRFGKNLAEIEREIDPSNIVNRLYPLGAGEGVNQLDITQVNGGVEYIESASSIAEYGLQSYVWVDRRYEDDESLLASGRNFLDEWSIPRVNYTVKAVDLSSLSGISIDKLTTGKVVRVTDPDLGTFNTRILNESKADIDGAPHDIDLELSNRDDDIGKTLADVERRQEVNEVYSQGATNIMTFGYQDNADDDIPAVIPFYIDEDVVNINTLELTFRTNKFRAYSQATKGGGSLVKSTGGGGGTVKSTSSGGGTTESTSSGGGSTATSSSGGGTSRSTNSGGGSSQTSAAGGDHRHSMFQTTGDRAASDRTVGASAADGVTIYLDGNSPYMTNVYTAGSSGNHTHSVSIPSHSHDFSTPNHTHNVDIPNHTHEVTISPHTHNIDLPNHTHEIELPNHTHDVEHKIVELDDVPSDVIIKVDGNTVPHTSNKGDRINLVDYIDKDSSGKISRGRHEVTILPNGLARIEADLILRVFIQSQLGGNF